MAMLLQAQCLRQSYKSGAEAGNGRIETGGSAEAGWGHYKKYDCCREIWGANIWHLPWSNKLMLKGVWAKYWRLGKKLQTGHDYSKQFQSISTILSCDKCSKDLSFSEVCCERSLAKRNLKKAQKDASSLRIMHINTKAKEWKELGYNDIASIVKKIKRKEYDDYVNRMIKNIFGKGQHNSASWSLFWSNATRNGWRSAILKK